MLFRSGFVLISVASLRAAFADGQEQGLKILNSNVVRIVYPYDLAIAGTDATVEVSYQVDPSGTATAVKVPTRPDSQASCVFETWSSRLRNVLFIAKSSSSPSL